MSLHIVRVVLDAPIDRSFDYRYQPSDGDEGMPQVGQLVAVPFGRRSVVGLVVSTGSSTDVPPEKLKDIAHCYHNIPSFDKAWLDLCRFAASYYHRALGEVALNVLPKIIRQNKQKSIEKALGVLDRMCLMPVSNRLPIPSSMQRVFRLSCFMVSQAVARPKSISGQ